MYNKLEQETQVIYKLHCACEYRLIRTVTIMSTVKMVITGLMRGAVVSLKE